MVTLKELLKYLVDNIDWITRNEQLEMALTEIDLHIPDIIKRNKDGKRTLKVKIASQILHLDVKVKKLYRYITNFPEFELDYEGIRKKEFNFDALVDVVNLKDGSSFGELALINNIARSATIYAVSEVHLATLEKEDFKIILGKAIRKKFENMLKFMENFIIFNDMPRLAQNKLTLFFKKEEVSRGNKIMKEQEESKNIFFIESGEFEVSKNVLISKGII